MNKFALSPLRQRGIATLLILLLVGLSINATVFSSLRFLQGTQDQSVAFHAQTQAQMRAWAGAEALFQYFDLLAVEGDVPWATVEPALVTARDSASNVLSSSNPIARVTRIDSANQRVFFTITGSAADGTRASASSSLEVVFQLDTIMNGSPGGSTGEVSGEVVPSVITFDRNLTMSGSITVNISAGSSYEVNVNGVVLTGGNSITGVDTIRATDSIQIGSGSTYKNLFSNGDIAITGSVTVANSMQALGNICYSGGTAFPGLTQANGFVYSNTSGPLGEVKARGASTYGGSNPLCNNYSLNDYTGTPFGVNLANSNTVGTVMSAKSVRNIGGNIGSLQAQGDLHVGYGRVNGGTISGVRRYCGNPCGTVPSWKAGDINVNIVPGFTVEIAELQPIEISLPGFDAYLVEMSANYVFKYDSAEGRMKVTIRNVEGIDDGTYYLMTYKPASTTYQDYLCTSISEGVCTDDPASRKTICKTSDSLIGGVAGRFQNDNACFSYAAGKWSVGGSGTNISIAQGIAWFEGNLEVKTGIFYNTFIATGHILTSGNHRTFSPNFAGPNGGGSYGGLTPKGICSNAWFPHYPTQLCAAFAAGTPLISGNYAFMAGSQVADSYFGGDIDLGASTLAFGSVLAGNEFGSSGSTTVYGYITALGGGTDTIDGNRLGNSTTINVSQLPATYTPQGGIGNTGTGTGTGGTEVEGVAARFLWARYL